MPEVNRFPQLGAECTSYFDGMVSGAGGWKGPANHYGQAFAKWQTTSIEEKWEDNPVYGNYYDNRNVPHKRVQYAEGVS